MIYASVMEVKLTPWS